MDTIIPVSSCNQCSQQYYQYKLTINKVLSPLCVFLHRDTICLTHLLFDGGDTTALSLPTVTEEIVCHMNILTSPESQLVTLRLIHSGGNDFTSEKFFYLRKCTFLDATSEILLKDNMVRWIGRDNTNGNIMFVTFTKYVKGSGQAANK